MKPFPSNLWWNGPWLVVLCGILGAATTVLIAWILVVFPHVPRPEPAFSLPFTPPDHHHYFQPPTVQESASRGRSTVAATSCGVTFMVIGDGPSGTTHEVYKDFPSTPTDKPLKKLIPRWAVADAQRAIGMNVDTSRPARLTISAAGWPRLALACVIDDANPSRVIKVTSGITITSEWLSRLTGSPGTVFNLPFRVLWKGAVVDTAAFGAVWGALLLAMLEVRRRLRVRRGVCPWCAYDLSGQPAHGCPECGWNRVSP